MENHCASSCTRSLGSNSKPAEGKIHFKDGKSSGRVRPDEPTDSRNSSLKFRPVLPRPWQRTAVNLCFEVGSTIVGSTIDHSKPSIFGSGSPDMMSRA